MAVGYLRSNCPNAVLSGPLFFTPYFGKMTPMPLTTPDNILQEGAPILREKARPVTKEEFGTAALRKIIAEMAKALEACDDGVAIAAPQIGVAKRIFLVSHRAFAIESGREARSANSKHPKDKDTVFINPRIVKASRRKIMMPEGCLSVRWVYGDVPRHEKVTIEALDVEGNKFSVGSSGLMAQIFQHETDHLDGILFIDTAKHLEQISPEEMEKLGSRLRP